MNPQSKAGLVSFLFIMGFLGSKKRELTFDKQDLSTVDIISTTF